jgi:hypothetical protein
MIEYDVASSEKVMMDNTYAERKVNEDERKRQQHQFAISILTMIFPFLFPRASNKKYTETKAIFFMILF